MDTEQVAHQFDSCQGNHDFILCVQLLFGQLVLQPSCNSMVHCLRRVCMCMHTCMCVHACGHVCVGGESVGEDVRRSGVKQPLSSLQLA